MGTFKSYLKDNVSVKLVNGDVYTYYQKTFCMEEKTIGIEHYNDNLEHDEDSSLNVEVIYE